MKKKDETERKKREAIREKRREKRLAQPKYGYQRRIYVYDLPDPQTIKEEIERRIRFRRWFSIVLIAAGIVGFVWSMVAFNRYVKVPATVTNVSSQKHYSVSTPRGRVYREVSESVTWTIAVRYYYNDAVYCGSFKMEGYNGQHLMIYCNKRNPQKCLPSLLDYWIILVVSIICLVVGVKYFPYQKRPTAISPEETAILPDNKSKKHHEKKGRNRKKKT